MAASRPRSPTVRKEGKFRHISSNVNICSCEATSVALPGGVVHLQFASEWRSCGVIHDRSGGVIVDRDGKRLAAAERQQSRDTLLHAAKPRKSDPTQPAIRD
jgi:hypothetical protein